jgi:hypothetical protein
MRYFEGEHTFQFDWTQVARAYWCRYPNPMSKHVLSEDVLERKIDEKGRLVTKRIFSKTNKVPKWAERFVSIRSIIIVEESIVDPKGKTFVTYTRNLGGKSYMTIDEKVTYSQSRENPNWTLTNRQGWVNSNMYGLSSVVQAFGIDRFQKNVHKARDGFQLVLDTMFNTGSQSFDIGGLNVSPMNDAGYLASAFHPLLMEKIKKRASKLTDKAKSKAAPMMATEKAFKGARGFE